jgi:hypothetical protein
VWLLWTRARAERARQGVEEIETEAARRGLLEGT